jgi:hypothetical protein
MAAKHYPKGLDNRMREVGTLGQEYRPNVAEPAHEGASAADRTR